MPARYLICPTLDGSVVPPDTPPEDAPGNRAAIADIAGISYTSLLPINNDDPPTPLYGFTLCHARHQTVDKLTEGVSNAYVFPDYSLDTRMDAMEPGIRTAFQQSVEAYNLDGNGLTIDASHTDSESYGTVIARIGGQIESPFNLNRFFAPEPQ